MTVAKLTKSTVDALAPGEMIWDTSLSGFGVRRQTKVPHYLVRYRFGGRQRYLTIGKHGSPWTVETARRKAKQLLGQIAGGSDPQAEKAKATLASAETFGAFIDPQATRPKAKVIQGYRAPFAPIFPATAFATAH